MQKEGRIKYGTASEKTSELKLPVVFGSPSAAIFRFAMHATFFDMTITGIMKTLPENKNRF